MLHFIIMNLKDFVTLVAMLGVVITMWWQLDTKIDREIHALDTKIERMNILLTNNLIELNRTMGELKGQSHTH